MVYVDVHAHLDDESFKNDLDLVIEKSKEKKVKVIIASGLDKKTNRIVIELSNKYDLVKASLGIYPFDKFDFDVDEEIEFIRENKDKIIALGEVGLDYSYEKVNKEEQKEIFVKFIKLSKKLDLPLIVHSRKAEEEVINLLEENEAKKVVMHCFSGNQKLIERAEKLKYYFSIPCNVERSQHFQNLVKMVNINQLLTETDSPYLGPEKDKRNDPSNIPIAVKKIAEIKGFEEEEVKNNIFMNYQRLFL